MVYRTRWLQIRMSPDELAHLDQIRGQAEKSDYVRTLIATQAPHRHVRDSKIREEYRKGLRVEVWACSCGKEMA